MFDRRRRLRAAALAFSIVSANALFLVIAPSPAGAATFSNACQNTASPNGTQLDVDLTGTAPASVAPGASFQLTGISQTLFLPGSLFVAGYNLGLLVVGSNTVPGTVKTVIEGTNTVQGTQTTPATAIGATFTITDPDGTPGSGDESATPAQVTVNYPDQTWTAGPAGAIAFREETIPLAVNTGGIVISATIGGFLTVGFRCSPGTVTPPDPGTITLTDPAPSFASTTSTTGGATTSTTGGATTTTAGGATTTTAGGATTTTAGGSTTTTTAPQGATSVTGTASFVTTCKNSVTPDASELTFAITGTAPTEVTAGAPVTLSKQSWTVAVPASVLNTGIGLGLLHIGDLVPGTVTPSLFATNTVEGTRTLAPIAVQIGPIQDDGTASVPPTAKPASTTFAVPDTSWTSVGGTVGYGLGSAAIEVALGPLKVKFTCTPKDASLAVVQTNVLGARLTRAADLPRTGFDPLGPLGLAVGFLGAGFLIQSVVSPSRRRRPDRPI